MNGSFSGILQKIGGYDIEQSEKPADRRHRRDRGDPRALRAGGGPAVCHRRALPHARRKGGGRRPGRERPRLPRRAAGGIRGGLQEIRPRREHAGHHLRRDGAQAFGTAAVRALSQQRRVALRHARSVRHLPGPESRGRLADGAHRLLEHLRMAQRARQRRRRAALRPLRHGRGLLHLARRRGLLDRPDDPAHDPLSPERARKAGGPAGAVA